jgi:hypothetical protein
MKATSAILQTDRFPAVWPDYPDRQPPPGKEFAQGILDALVRAGAQPSSPTLGERDYEHSSWFFFVEWPGCKLTIDVELSVEDSVPATWRVAVCRRLTLWQSLFGRSDVRFDVPDCHLQTVARAVQQAAGCGPLAWITEDQALDALWGGAR